MLYFNLESFIHFIDSIQNSWVKISRRQKKVYKINSGANKCWSDWRILQSACEQRVPKHVSIRGFKKLDVVLETAVSRVGLLQSLLHALQLTLVAALHLEEHRNAHKNQLCSNLLFKHVNLQSTQKPENISFFLEPLSKYNKTINALVLQNCPTQRGTIVMLST